MEEHHSRDLQHDIVFGNDVLGRHIHRNHPGIELVHALDAGDEEGDPRAADRLKFPQAQDDPALPFTQDLDVLARITTRTMSTNPIASIATSPL
jgi:hypothetical protein